MQGCTSQTKDHANQPTTCVPSKPTTQSCAYLLYATRVDYAGRAFRCFSSITRHDICPNPSIPRFNIEINICPIRIYLRRCLQAKEQTNSLTRCHLRVASSTNVSDFNNKDKPNSGQLTSTSYFPRSANKAFYTKSRLQYRRKHNLYNATRQ